MSERREGAGDVVEARNKGKARGAKNKAAWIRSKPRQDEDRNCSCDLGLSLASNSTPFTFAHTTLNAL